MRLGFLASHNGSNLQAILDACKSGAISAIPAIVISNNSGARALERARAATVATAHLSSVTHPMPEDLDQAILDALTANDVDLVVLAGYMKRLGPKTLAHYRGRVVNTHPALLPKYGGVGFWGARVHEAVLASGDKATGITIHVVDEQYDEGPIIAQREVPVLPGDDVDTLTARVKAAEHPFFVETIGRIAAGELKLPSS